jgi:hypothetical protein
MAFEDRFKNREWTPREINSETILFVSFVVHLSCEYARPDRVSTIGDPALQACTKIA